MLDSCPPLPSAQLRLPTVAAAAARHFVLAADNFAECLIHAPLLTKLSLLLAALPVSRDQLRYLCSAAPGPLFFCWSVFHADQPPAFALPNSRWG
jgi:hypothetical protein